VARLPAFALGALGVKVLRAALPPDTPRLSAIALDGVVLAVCAGLAVVVGIVFGLAPAFLASRGDMQDALRGARGVAWARGRRASAWCARGGRGGADARARDRSRGS
jgi:hypothetical protein